MRALDQEVIDVVWQAMEPLLPRYGQKMWDSKREPKIMGARKRQAEVAAGKHRGTHLERLERSRDRLAEALASYRGALLVASHDLPFLRAIGITRWLRLAGRLTHCQAAARSSRRTRISGRRGAARAPRSTWRTRSRETPITAPTSSRVRGVPESSP
jgi:hypothetical protein